MNKLEELLAQAKAKDLKELKELLGRKQVVEEKKKCPFVWLLAIVGFVAVVAGIAYAVYRYFTPDYLEDFEDEDYDDDDFEDDDSFEDDFFEEEKDTEE